MTSESPDQSACRLWVDRPAAPSGPIEHFDEKFSGKSTSAKLVDVRAKLKTEAATHVALTSLDDVSWLFNLRAADVPNTPFVRGFGIVSDEAAVVFVDEDRLTAEAKAALVEACVSTRPYEDFLGALMELPSDAKVILNKQAACFVESIAKENRLLVFANPVTQLKAIKNSVELEGFKSCHIQDGVAVCRYLSWLFGLPDDELTALNEFSAAEHLEKLRREEPCNRGTSFTSISSIGANAAIIHYHPTATKNSPMSRDLYLIDSGGQYL